MTEEKKNEGSLVALDESKLRFDLFPENATRFTGAGIPGLLFEVLPHAVEKTIAGAEVLSHAEWTRFCKHTWETNAKTRVLWLASPAADFRETVLDIAHPQHLHPGSWTQVAVWPIAGHAPCRMVCDDKEGRKRRGMGDTVSYHLLLHRVNPTVVRLPKDCKGALYLLRPHKELIASRMVDSVTIPVSVRVRLTRSLLARAAWLKIQKALKKRVTERVLRLDTCVNLDVYGLTDRDDPPLKWNACWLGSCAPDALDRLAQHLDAWVRRETNGHVYARVLRVSASDLASADDVPYLFALIQFSVWVLLVRSSMRDYLVEVTGLPVGACRELWAQMDAATALKRLGKRSLPQTVASAYALLLKRDQLLLPSMKLVLAN